ncbi:MAG: Gfo/Idh/MocA family oxidoreductase [bacterium]
MKKPIKMAMVGVGRIGMFHARHIQELSRETGKCELAAVVDTYRDTAVRVTEQLQQRQETEIKPFSNIDDLANAGLVDAAMIATRTKDHERDASTLVKAGCRVLLEKPLAESIQTAETFTSWLNADDKRKQAVMLAFQRRFDDPLIFAKKLINTGKIGRPFKFVSVLEDPLPPPDGYFSPGLLIDMAVHNIDEILWLSGAQPKRAMAFGSNLYNHTISAVKEDFDDAFLQLWFPGNVLGQVQVSRNHVAGYRNETWIYGDRGLIHVGHFQENPFSVSVEAYSTTGVIEKQIFALKDYGDNVPVFIKRFGEAYKGELAYFVEQCLNDEPFSVTHEDGLLAMKVAVFGQDAIRTEKEAVEIVY